MPPNRLFLCSALLDRFVSLGHVEFGENEFTIRGTGERYAVEEASRIVREVTGGGDARGLVGRVRSLGDLRALGAEVVDRSMVIGELAYDVVPGFLASPAGSDRVPTARTLAALSALSDAPKSGQSDEDLLARYLIQNLQR